MNPRAATQPNSLLSALSLRLDRWFHVSERGSRIRLELLAGFTTFSTMSYVLVVQPLLLSTTGMDRAALITATAVTAALFTLIMGLITNYPLAMAPGMGANLYIASQVCLGMHIPWNAALGLVFYTGLLFFLIAVTGIQQKLIEAFPYSFKKTISAGIGLFIAFLGLRNAGIVASNARTIISLGDFKQPMVLLAFGGILLAIVLVIRKVPGALLLSITTLTVAGFFLPNVKHTGPITALPTHIFSWPNSMAVVTSKVDFAYLWQHPSQSFPIVITLLFIDLFSAMAVLFAIGHRAGLNDADGNLPRLKHALVVDALAASGGAVLGNTTTIIYLESAAGVEQGGRTGLTSVAVSLSFLLALFLTPILAVIPPVATTPALVMIGIFMMQGLGELDLKDIRITTMVLLTLLLMALTSVSDGLALGFIVEVVTRSASGQARSIKPIGWILVALFALHFLL